MTNSLRTRPPDARVPTGDSDDRAPASRPYAPPALSALGRVDAATAGPSSAGELDTLFGGDGGFREPDTTS